MNNTDNAARTGEVAQHTPTPWRSRQEGRLNQFILGPDDEAIANLNNHGMAMAGKNHANAAFIVRACNSHAALVEAVRLSSLLLHKNYGHLKSPNPSDIEEALAAIRAALALAKGGQQ